MRRWKCEFCQKWEFENVNFVKNENLKIWQQLTQDWHAENWAEKFSSKSRFAGAELFSLSSATIVNKQSRNLSWRWKKCRTQNLRIFTKVSRIEPKNKWKMWLSSARLSHYSETSFKLGDFISEATRLGFWQGIHTCIR